MRCSELCAPAHSHLLSAKDLVRRDTVAPVSSIFPVILQVLLLQQLNNMHTRSVMQMYAADISSNDGRGCEYVDMQTVRHFVNAVTRGDCEMRLIRFKLTPFIRL